MRYVAYVIIAGLCFNTIAFGKGLYLKKDSGEFVYTNIGRVSFFKRAFSVGIKENLPKKKVMNIIKKMARKMDVNPKLVLAIAKIESDFNNRSISKSGARGVMQLIDQTAAFYGVKNINNLQENIAGGIRFLKHLTKKYKNLKLVAAAYNAGETVVDKYRGIPPFRETQMYVKKFLKAYYGKKIQYIKAKKHTKTFQSKPIKKIGNTYSNISGNIW